MYYNELLKSLGERIRFIRRNKGIKQEKLAELVNKTTEHISLIERGERAPSLELLLDLSNALDISLSYLFDITSNEQEDVEPIPAPIPTDSLPELTGEPIKSEEIRKSDLERMQEAYEQVQELQKLAKEYGIADIFQDNGGKVLQVLIVLKLKISPGREGNDAIDDDGNEYELKTVNYKLTTQISTHHHLNKEILAKYRKVKAWCFAIYEDIELCEIWKILPSQLEELFQRWEMQIEEKGVELNNPKVPLWFVQKGECVYQNPNKSRVPPGREPLWRVKQRKHLEQDT